ncbi:MAG: hypothetical protein JSS82_06075 [Bacteroidetes bacterium]|nr:hypothetical protein [Bacteroidota bacterium]
MKPILISCCILLSLITGTKAQILDTSDLRRIEQRRNFAPEFYRYPRGSAAYCAAADELAFICACEGKKDSAFYFLSETFSYTGTDTKALLSIYDPYNLGKYPYMKWKSSKEWKLYEKTVTDKYMELSKGLKQPKLTFELLKAYGRDQSVRFYLMKIHHDSIARKDVRKIDSTNLVFVKQLINTNGYPPISSVGENASEAVFLLCQHADKDVPFQKRVLEMMKKLNSTGDVNKEHLAYLTDRIMVAEKGQQLYGTQFKEGNTLYPIMDSANVDKRRAEMGLGTIADYRKGIWGNLH